MSIMINKDTRVCMSLAARPSNFGTFFHNYLYEKLELNYIYKAFTTRNLKEAIYGVKALDIRGCAISMPYKEACIPFLDELDKSAQSIESVNTIVNTDGYLKGYNTDYIAIVELLKLNQISLETSFVVQGSGGMAKAVLGALFDLGFKNGTVLARNEQKGSALASLYHYEYAISEIELSQPEMLINVTPIGMKGGQEVNELAFYLDLIMKANIIFDVVALPVQTPLIKAAQELNKIVISGADVATIQALEQFVLYTGIRPGIDLVKEAAQFARERV